MPTAIEEFERIIRYQDAEELIPFLLTLAKPDLPAARTVLKSLVAELHTVVQLSENSWGAKATNAQSENLFLAGIAVLARQEILKGAINGAWIIGAHATATATRFKANFLTLVTALRPAWLAEWLLGLQARAAGWAVDYALLRALEEAQLIAYSPQLTGRALPSALHQWGWDLSQAPTMPANATEAITDQLRADHVLLTRDLPLIFDFDNPISGIQAQIQPPLPPKQETDKWATSGEYPWQIWNRTHPPQRVSWHAILLSLSATRHLDRADLLTRCLLALRRDFRRPLLTWFKELFLALKPTVSERLARQADLVELLAHPLPLVVNFAIEQLKNVWLEPGFDLTPLLRLADNLFTRFDLKTGLKTLLSGLGKLPRHDATHAPAVARLLAAALAHPDTAVQEPAAKNLAALLNPKKPVLTAADISALTATIEGQAELLGAAARATLAPWLAAAPAAAALAKTTASYYPRAQFVPDISPATAIVPVADWHELLFLTGQVLRHDDPAALERWLEGLLRLRGQLPTGHTEQLRPYLLLAVPQLRKANPAETDALLSGPTPIWGHDGLAQALLLSWATGFRTPRVATVQVQARSLQRMPVLEVEQLRYAQAEGLLRGKLALPLLSTPTHAPHWVAPTTLATKLLAYEAAGHEPAVADLALALARTAHAHPDAAAAAQHLLPQLQHAGLRELLAWFFGPAATPLPAPGSAAAATRPAASATATLAEALPELWAVAARTKAPQQAFPTLPTRLGYDYAGVAQPLRLVREVVAQENTYDPSYQVAEEPTTHRWTEIYWRSGPTEAAPSALLLYAPPAGTGRQGSWEDNQLLASDFAYLAAALPNYPAPLHEYVLRCAAWADNLESSERDLVAQALRALLTPGPAHAPAATAVLASGLLHHTPLCRSLAQEVLLRAVANGQLLPATLGQVLGQQLSTGYAPVPRLASSLATLGGIDAPTDDALHQVLDALLPELPAAPLRSMRPLLDLYADLRARTGRPTPAAVQARLGTWRTVPSLKMVASALAA